MIVRAILETRCGCSRELPGIWSYPPRDRIFVDLQKSSRFSDDINSNLSLMQLSTEIREFALFRTTRSSINPDKIWAVYREVAR